MAQAILRSGSHTWPNLVDIGPSDPPPAFDFEASRLRLAVGLKEGDHLC
jgi:hypothetical protein